jgi:hypothetical protein
MQNRRKNKPVMRNKSLKHCSNRSQAGIVLMITLILLVVLATLGYTLSSRVAAQRHRDLYIIDYCKARYACDSAVKYALATMQDINPQLISRPNEPDFSDLFVLSRAEYQQLLVHWAAESISETKDATQNIKSINDINNTDKIIDINDFNDIDANESGLNDAGFMTIPGPYGPPWPFVTEPVDFEIGSAAIKIEIEDENAKYPVSWLTCSEGQMQREIEAGFEIFCEWMGIRNEQIDSIKQQLNQIKGIRSFQFEFKPIKQTVVVPPRQVPSTNDQKTGAKTIRTPPRPTTTIKTIPVSDQVARQNTDFAKLFHSSLIDTESLARPYMEDRPESALKYMSMWASNKVNINTAPRHVLEAAFAFGGTSDAPQIANEIIQQRRKRPFTDIEDLKNTLAGYSVSISKCEKYITTVSDFFSIKVTAISGVAKTSATIGIAKNGKQIQRTAVISD